MAPNRRICSGWETWLGWRLYLATSHRSTSSRFCSWRSPRLKGTVSRDWIGPCVGGGCTRGPLLTQPRRASTVGAHQDLNNIYFYVYCLYVKLLRNVYAQRNSILWYPLLTDSLIFYDFFMKYIFPNNICSFLLLKKIIDS